RSDPADEPGAARGGAGPVPDGDALRAGHRGGRGPRGAAGLDGPRVHGEPGLPDGVVRGRAGPDRDHRRDPGDPGGRVRGEAHRPGEAPQGDLPGLPRLRARGSEDGLRGRPAQKKSRIPPVTLRPPTSTSSSSPVAGTSFALARAKRTLVPRPKLLPRRKSRAPPTWKPIGLSFTFFEGVAV